MILHKTQCMQSKPFATSLFFKVLTMFVITFVGSIALATPIQAHAKIVAYQNGQPITWAGKKGNVIIGECTTKLMTGSVDGDGDQLFRLTMPDGSTIDAFCRDKENAAPADAKYYFAAFPSDGLDQEDMNNLYNNRESNRRHNLRIDLNQEDIKCRGEKGSYVIYVDTSGATSPPGFRVSPDGKSAISIRLLNVLSLSHGVLALRLR